MPYKRGPYNTDSSNSAASAIRGGSKRARSEAEEGSGKPKGGGKSEGSEKPRAVDMQAFKEVKAEMEKLKKDLPTEIESRVNAIVANALDDASAKMGFQLMNAYKEGLGDGARLANGGLPLGMTGSSTSQPPMTARANMNSRSCSSEPRSDSRGRGHGSYGASTPSSMDFPASRYDRERGESSW